MNDRQMLNRIINNLLVAESTRTVIRYLLYLGFTVDEIESLNFMKEEIIEVKEEMDRNGYEGECVCPVFA